MAGVKTNQSTAARLPGLLLVALLTAFCLPLESLAAGEERVVIDPAAKGAGYSAVLYDNTSGLPTSEANVIAATPDGFLWIGGYAGLIRYDGNIFERLDSTTGLASVVSLLADSKERLWVGTNESGFTYASAYGIRYHDLPEGADASFFLCKELLPGYLSGVTGKYAPPEGYFVAEREPEAFERFDALFPPKEKLKLPGQLF